jgi:hypothetical protein
MAKHLSRPIANQIREAREHFRQISLTDDPFTLIFASVPDNPLATFTIQLPRDFPNSPPQVTPICDLPLINDWCSSFTLLDVCECLFYLGEDRMPYRPPQLSKDEISRKLEDILPGDPSWGARDLLERLALDPIIQAKADAEKAKQSVAAIKAEIPTFQQQQRELMAQYREIEIECKELEKIRQNPGEYFLRQRQVRMVELADQIERDAGELERLREQFKSGGVLSQNDFAKKILEIKKRQCFNEEMMKMLEELTGEE